MGSVVLYAIGAGSVGLGFYEVWRDGTIDHQAFVVGGMCIVTAAGLQIVRDVWRRLRR
jgi:hypothetical protein